MTDQPRDLAREVEQIRQKCPAFHTARKWRDVQTLLNFIASQSAELEAVTAGARRTAELNVQVGQENRRLRDELQVTSEALALVCRAGHGIFHSDGTPINAPAYMHPILAKALEGK